MAFKQKQNNHSPLVILLLAWCLVIVLDNVVAEKWRCTATNPAQGGTRVQFTIKRGVSTKNTVSVNSDDFVNDVAVGDTLLVCGGMMSFAVKSKTKDTVKCEVMDGGELKSSRHLNVCGKSATLPSITGSAQTKTGRYKAWDYLKRSNADIHVNVKIESADSMPNLHSIISTPDGVGSDWWGGAEQWLWHWHHVPAPKTTMKVSLLLVLCNISIRRRWLSVMAGIERDSGG
ncbi:hypothetical protein Vadar_024494 [Vaccinium darrowii]|uniref:Uncharacterized protein n=1 Tax=Vaccinium darrowii TaxID=229202 RepID=A0ACB7XJR2_9ERIC|nr:hypothetical protein Vadar_024494 [Vaccinium darrowii]